MTRPPIKLRIDGRDGTSQRGRTLPALDPGGAAIDERSHADLLDLVRELAAKLRFFESVDGEVRHTGEWTSFVERGDISIADIVAYMEDPERFGGDKARWLGRPHFALLLTFLELFGHARDHLNSLTRRHLDYYYRELLQMLPEGGRPDRATVVFRLAPKAGGVRLPAGTALQAGRDGSGTPRIYKTEREIVINRARVDAIRSLHVDRRITGIPAVRNNRSLPPAEVFETMLSIALGEPRPGEPVPPWRGAATDVKSVRGLRAPLAFARETLGLEHHELRSLMQLVRRRLTADHEWAEINRLLGVQNPNDPRDFAANLARAFPELDFSRDELEQVHDIDDLYDDRGEPKVKNFIVKQFAALDVDPVRRLEKFGRFMAIKRRIDLEWAEIDRLLERIARRRKAGSDWRPEPFDPADFDANLAAALGPQPPPWPWGASLGEYEAALRDLEAHFSTPVEQLLRLVEIAHKTAGGEPSDSEWSELDRILADAHREKHYAARRRKLAAARGASDDVVGFGRVVRAALPVALADDDGAITEANADRKWIEALPLLGRHLHSGQIAVLEGFRRGLVDRAAPRTAGWDDVYRVLELAQRYDEALPEPVAETTEWRNLYAFEDATALVADPTSPRWKTFGRRPVASDTIQPAGLLGWAVCSPLLALSQGKRTLAVTFGFDEFDRKSFLRALGLDVGAPADDLRRTLGEVLKIEVSTAKGWVELVLAGATLVSGAPGDDYWTLLGSVRPADARCPALRIELSAAPTVAPFAPVAGSAEPWPTLRVTLRALEVKKERITRLDPFAPLVLAAVHLRVKVEGLADLRLQHEDRPLDPRRPFEPFGSHPVVGARMYLGHPELMRARLDSFQLHIEWMGLPPGLKAHYANYATEPAIPGGEHFRAALDLVDDNVEFPLGVVKLFTDTGEKTDSVRDMAIGQVAALIEAPYPGHVYGRRPELAPTADLRAATRYLRLELTPNDFGHSAYPMLAAQMARELAAHLSNPEIKVKTPGKYSVNPPYTPTIKRLRVDYETSREFSARDPGDRHDRLLHVHPFGLSALDLAASEPGERHLFPRYEAAGELYIGLREVDAPQLLTLFMQLAEGTSDSELALPSVEWSVLDGDRWVSLRGNILHDSTRGLINSGIIELRLPAVAPSTRLPGGFYWLRAAVARGPSSVCDTVAIRTQAVTVCFEDRNNDPSHYERPLAVRSIDRLVAPDARIAAIEQPYTSFGGKPPERSEQFYTRVSERLRHRRRALTPWDYERLVLQRFPQIYRAKCLPVGVTGHEPGRVEIIVVPDIRAQLPADVFAPRAPANLLADIQSYLGERAPTSASVVVRNARYVPVSVRLGVRFRAGQDERHAQKQLSDDLNRFLSPWAYDEGAELVIGGKIYANSILDFVDRRDYIDYVAELKLFRDVDGHGLKLVPPPADNVAYHVAVGGPDQVLVAARQHHIDVISELEYQQASFTGIKYMKIGLDFMVR